MQHIDKISGQLAHNPAEKDQILPMGELARTRQNSAKGWQENNRLLDWFSARQAEIRARPMPYYLAGLGLALGGIAFGWARQRKKSILRRDFSGLAGKIDTHAREES